MRSEPDRFEEVAAELSRPLLRYLETYVGDRATGEDLLQETLIRMSRGFDAFRGEASPKTWTFSIATRVASDHFRKPENRRQIIPGLSWRQRNAGGAARRQFPRDSPFPTHSISTS